MRKYESWDILEAGSIESKNIAKLSSGTSLLQEALGKGLSRTTRSRSAIPRLERPSLSVSAALFLPRSDRIVLSPE